MEQGAGDGTDALRAENERLRRRVEELEGSLAEREAGGARPGKAGGDVSFEQVFDSLPVPIMVHWPDGRVAAANARQVELVGVPREKLLNGRSSIYDDQRPITQAFIAAFERAAGGETAKMPPAHYSNVGANLEG